MDALQFSDVVRIGDADWAEILCAEPSQTLFGNGDADFLDAVNVGNFGENFFLFRVEREDSQVFSIKDAENLFTQIEENMVKIAGCVNLFRDALDVLDKCHFLLKFLKVLWDGIGLHDMGS